MFPEHVSCELDPRWVASDPQTTWVCGRTTDSGDIFTHQLMANQPDSSQLGARPDPGRESDPLLHYPAGLLCDGQQLPDIPKTVNWGTALLILSAIPLLLVFVDNVFSMPTVAPSADFPAHSDGVMLLLNIGYLMLAVSILNGRQRTRTTATVVTVIFHFFLLVIIADLGFRLGLVSGSDMGVVLLIFAWTAVLSGVGLVLLHTPASNTYITRSEAYQVYVDQQNTNRTLRWRPARLDRRK